MNFSDRSVTETNLHVNQILKAFKMYILDCRNPFIWFFPILLYSAQVNSCIYKGKTYQQDEHFDDGCRYKCFCEDASTGKYVCREK